MSPYEIREMLAKNENTENAIEKRRNALAKKFASDLGLENSNIVYGLLVPPEMVDGVVDGVVDGAAREEAEEEARKQAEKEVMEDRYADKRKVVEEALKKVSQKRMIEIFPKAEIERCRTISATMSSDNKVRVKSVLKLIEVNDGKREMPSFKNVKKTLDGMKRLFGNFTEVLDDYANDLTFAGIADPLAMRIPPYLLDGAPGLGKTAFCIALAKALKLPFIKLSAGGMQAGAILAGTASHWSNSQTGEVFNLLAHQSTSSGCAVLLIDEVDKLVNYGDGHNCIPALLDLLEPESARVYRDESLCMNFDASHLIIILTCNYPEEIEPALLSRCKIRTIEAPGVAQKVAIANEIHKDINASLPKSKRTVLDKESLDKLVQIEGMDIRALIRCVQKACSEALLTKNKVAWPQEEIRNGQTSRPFGFIHGKE